MSVLPILRMPRFPRSRNTKRESFSSPSAVLDKESAQRKINHSRSICQKQTLPQEQKNSVHFGKVAIMEFDEQNASCDTIQRDRWAALRPESNKTYSRPNIYNPRGSLVLFGRHSSASSRPMQPKRRESDAVTAAAAESKADRRALLLQQHHSGTRLSPNLPMRRSSVDKIDSNNNNNTNNNKNHTNNNKSKNNMPMRLPRRRSSSGQQQRQQQETQEEGSTRRSSFVLLTFPQFRRRRSSVMRAAGTAMQLRLPRRRSSCVVQEDDSLASQTQTYNNES